MNTLDRQTKRVLFSLGICILFFVWVFFFTPSFQDGSCYAYNDFKKMEINGVIVQKFRNPNEHSYPTLMIQNFNSDSIQSLILTGDTTNSYEILNAFDTIVKKKGEVLLYRKESGTFRLINEIDFGCIKK